MMLTGAFLKFGKKIHLEDLRKGKVYCNTLQHFTVTEENYDGRRDEDENVFSFKFLENAIFTITPSNKVDYHQFTAKNIHLKERILSPVGNLFCLYLLNVYDFPKGEEISVDNRCKEFGNHLLVISDVREFMKRIKTKLEELNYGFKAQLVTYKNFQKYSGGKSWFEKDLAFDYQKEYRILITTPLSEALILDIGNIEDITSEIWQCPKETDIKFKV